jgi:hypothetical protein
MDCNDGNERLEGAGIDAEPRGSVDDATDDDGTDSGSTVEVVEGGSAGDESTAKSTPQNNEQTLRFYSLGFESCFCFLEHTTVPFLIPHCRCFLSCSNSRKPYTRTLAMLVMNSSV